MILRKLSEVAPPSASCTKPAANDTVWHLTLDQIETGSGRIDRRVYGLASDAGSSSFAFDNGNVLYSKLRPYLNKVICPDTNGIATTELKW
jgi:type I restriction enzyme S subunit